MNSQADLLKDVKDKKVEAFEELYRLYYTDLSIFAQTYVCQIDIAEDMVQELFFQLWDKSVSQRINTSLKSYLYSTIRNKCLNHLRHLKVEDKYRKKEMDAIHISGTYEMVTDEDLIKQVKRAVEELPDKCKRIFKMSVIQGMKYKEIAIELDISIDTVKDHMKRAYRFLRQYKLDDFLRILVLLISKESL